jgi:hypothetical protein
MFIFPINGVSKPSPGPLIVLPTGRPLTISLEVKTEFTTAHTDSQSQIIPATDGSPKLWKRINFRVLPVYFGSSEYRKVLEAYRSEYGPVGEGYISEATELGKAASLPQTPQHVDHGPDEEENPQAASPIDDNDRPEVDSEHQAQTHNKHGENP